MQQIKRKAIRVLSGTLIVYALLVATHLGEFWPFSIYPMFSQAGNPWTRSLVRDVTDVDRTKIWHTVSFDSLPGEEFPIDLVGINQNDVSNFLQKANTWDQQKIEGMRRLFSSELEDRELLLMSVEGRLVSESTDTVLIDYTPFLLMEEDTTIFNPALNINH